MDGLSVFGDPAPRSTEISIEKSVRRFMKLHRDMRWKLGLLFCGCAVLAGCGTSEYEERLGKTLQEMQSNSKYSEVLKQDAEPIPDTQLAFRVPKRFTQAPLAKGAVDVKRFSPFGKEMSGQKLAFEDFIEDSKGGKTAYYLYVAVVDMPQGREPVAFMNAVIDGLSMNVKDAKSEPVADKPCETPSGAATPWKYFRSTFSASFYYEPKQGQPGFRSEKGVTDCYSRVIDDKIVILYWAVPNRLLDSVDLDSLAPMVAGCVEKK